jgi:hypothetical protein
MPPPDAPTADKTPLNNQSSTTSPNLNGSQATGMVERLIYGAALAAAMRLAQKGYITADEAPWIAGGVVGAVGSAFAWWRNRPVALALAAASISPDTKIVTSPAVAEATPQAPNIVSSNEVTVKDKPQ